MSDFKNLPDWTNWLLEKKANEEAELLSKGSDEDDAKAADEHREMVRDRLLNAGKKSEKQIRAEGNKLLAPKSKPISSQQLREMNKKPEPKKEVKVINRKKDDRSIGHVLANNPELRQKALEANQAEHKKKALEHAQQKAKEIEQNKHHDKAVDTVDHDARPAVAQKKRTATFISQFNRRKDAPDNKLIARMDPKESVKKSIEGDTMSDMKNLPDWNQWILEKNAKFEEESLEKSIMPTSQPRPESPSSIVKPKSKDKKPAVPVLEPGINPNAKLKKSATEEMVEFLEKAVRESRVGSPAAYENPENVEGAGKEKRYQGGDPRHFYGRRKDGKEDKTRAGIEREVPHDEASGKPKAMVSGVSSLRPEKHNEYNRETTIERGSNKEVKWRKSLDDSETTLKKSAAEEMVEYLEKHLKD